MLFINQNEQDIQFYTGEIGKSQDTLKYSATFNGNWWELFCYEVKDGAGHYTPITGNCFLRTVDAVFAQVQLLYIEEVIRNCRQSCELTPPS